MYKQILNKLKENDKMKNLSNEMLQKAKECKTVEELLNLAKDNDYPLTEEQATKTFNEWNKTGELADEELENVAGGGCGDPVGKNVEKLQKGDYVRFIDGRTCTLKDCGNDVFKLVPGYLGELYGRCTKCQYAENKVFRYNEVTRA